MCSISSLSVHYQTDYWLRVAPQWLMRKQIGKRHGLRRSTYSYSYKFPWACPQIRCAKHIHMPNQSTVLPPPPHHHHQKKKLIHHGRKLWQCTCCHIRIWKGWSQWTHNNYKNNIPPWLVYIRYTVSSSKVVLWFVLHVACVSLALVVIQTT